MANETKKQRFRFVQTQAQSADKGRDHDATLARGTGDAASTSPRPDAPDHREEVA
jgi:hypothetical protein